MGEMVSRLAQKELEPAREVMRRLMWSLNEESGAVGWGAPEALAEIMAQNEALCAEYLNIFVSYVHPGPNHLDFLPLLRGAVWGLGRIAQRWPQELRRRDAGAQLLPLLGRPDAALRGLAAWALGQMGDGRALRELANLRGDPAETFLWANWSLTARTVGELAREARQRLMGQTAQQG